jgi:hypothetical protein
MTRRGLTNLVSAATAAGLCAALLATGASAGPSSGGQPELLPDLDQQTPTALRIANVSKGGPARYVLGFQSAVRNIGDGPLIIAGTRASTSTPTMRAHQLVDRSDGTQTTVGGAGRLRYAISPTHQHWHLLHFDRYELRRAGQTRALVRDQKTGFCLGDRYRVVGYDVPSAKPDPSYIGGCGLREPRRLDVEEGISPGYGDNYLPYLEGQSVPLNGVAAGRYVLVHRVNTDRSLQESNYANDAASVLLDLRWHGRLPVVTQLATCPDTATCDAEPFAASVPSFTGPTNVGTGFAGEP